MKALLAALRRVIEAPKPRAKVYAEELDFASYRLNRDLGESANSLPLMYAFGRRAPMLEARYQRERAEQNREAA